MTGKMQIKNRLIMEECFTCVKTTISFDNLNIILHFIPSVIQVQLSSIFFFKNRSFFIIFRIINVTYCVFTVCQLGIMTALKLHIISNNIFCLMIGNLDAAFAIICLNVGII